ncbi:MAG: hypothetical protein WBP12_00730 [Candidatus Saccharimonas sp.]
MARLPVPGGDSSNWGTILNDYLSQALKPDGTIKDNAVTANNIAPNSITNAAIASDAVNASSIVDGSITEVLLSSAVQTKLNATAGSPSWNDITSKPAVIAAGATQAAARSSIGAGTSDLTLGTTSTTAKPGDYMPDWADIGGKPSVIAAGATQAAARSAIGAGTSNLVIGTTSTTAKAGDYAPAWIEITGKPSVIAAGATQADARTAIGAGTSNLVLGTTSTTAKSGDYAPSWVDITDKPTVVGAGATQADARAAIGAGSSNLTIGTTSTTAKAGDYTPTKSEIGIANIDNTSDLNKPISTAAQTALDAKADLVNGVIPTNQLPALALTSVVSVVNQTAMLALTSAQVQPGDIAVRTDGAGTFVLTAADPSVLASWTRLNAPTDLVTSVNGHIGDVVLGKADVGLANIDNTSDLNKPISSAAQTALNAKADLVNGMVPTSQLPSLALTNVVTVANQTAMLALTTTQVQPGDIAIRTDGAGTFILTDADPSVLVNWSLLSSPTDAVTSVNGHTGTVLLTKSDVGLANVDNTSDATKNSATATLTNKTIDGGTNTLQNIPQSAVSGLTASLAAKFARSITTITNPVTIGSTAGTDYVVFIDTAGEPTLPSAVGNTNKYTLKNIADDARPIATTASQTIEDSSVTTLAPNASIDLLSDGANWRII